MGQHEAYRGKRVVVNGADSSRRFNLSQCLVACVAYLIILIVRAWGAQRFLHFEETWMVGASRSMSTVAVWDDHAYGMFIQWFLNEVPTFFDLLWTPSILVGLSILTWLSCAVWINQTLIRVGAPVAVAIVGPLALCLLPLPEVAYIGLSSSSGFPLAVAVIVIVSISDLPTTRRKSIFELAIFSLVAASTPTAIVGAAVAGLRLLAKNGSRRTNILRISVIFFGTAISLAVARFQEAPMTYLGNWDPSTNADREVLNRITDSGGYSVRERASVGLVKTLLNVPGTIRFVVTQFYPEPWASRAILETSGLVKFFQVVVPLLSVIVIVAIIARFSSLSTESSSIKVALWLFIGAGMSVIIQHFIVGQLTSRQYLFIPLALFWMAVLILISSAVVARFSRAIILLLPLIFCFVSVVFQNFRDPFQENPRQGGTGRYAKIELWRPALTKARQDCKLLDESTVVVISQVNPNDPMIKQMINTSGLKFAWFDHPFVARCYVIRDR